MCRVLIGLVIAIGLPLRPGPAAPDAPYALAPQAPHAHQAPHELSFHHLHLNDPQWPFLLDFYQRLFDPSVTARFSAGSVDGLRSGSMLMLINRASYASPHASAIWHFGWGLVSLGESYLAHAGREVAWEPPLPSDLLHLHLLSVTPSSAAAWYREVLGARVELAVLPTSSGPRDLPPFEQRMPEALVWIGDTGLLIYRAAPPLLSTRGQRADHFAIVSPNFEQLVSGLRARGVEVMVGASQGLSGRTAMIEGPDQIAIEIVEGA